MKDYYTVLGVSYNVSQEVLDAVYKKLIYKYTNSSENDGKNEQLIKEINEAYEILSDPEKRSKYDEKLNNAY